MGLWLPPRPAPRRLIAFIILFPLVKPAASPRGRSFFPPLAAGFTKYNSEFRILNYPAPFRQEFSKKRRIDP